MKAIKDCRLILTIKYVKPIKKNGAYWYVTNPEEIGLVSCMAKNIYDKPLQAKDDFVEFANLNNITNYKFI